MFVCLPDCHCLYMSVFPSVCMPRALLICQLLRFYGQISGPSTVLVASLGSNPGGHPCILSGNPVVSDQKAAFELGPPQNSLEFQTKGLDRIWDIFDYGIGTLNRLKDLESTRKRAKEVLKLLDKGGL